MTQMVINKQTVLSKEAVMRKAVEYFTGEKWTCQTQTEEIITFTSKTGPTGCAIFLSLILVIAGVMLSVTGFLAIIGIPLFIIGAIIAIRTRLQLSGIKGKENLAITLNQLPVGVEVAIKYPKSAKYEVTNFLSKISEKNGYDLLHQQNVNKSEQPEFLYDNYSLNEEFQQIEPINNTTIPWFGGTYTGQVKDGKPDGQGKIIIPEKAEYAGEWKDGKPDGFGNMKYAGGATYVGEFASGNKHGQGTYTYSDGRELRGEWENGKYKK